MERYLRLFFDLQLAQWENYAETAKHDLSLLDEAIYRCLQEASASEWDHSDSEQRLYRIIRQRGLVDRHPQVSRLRNRLDDWDNYSAGMTDQQLKDSRAYRLALAKSMRPDVLQLLQLRQDLARQQGFDAYPQLVLQTEGLDYDWTRSRVLAYLQQHLATARELVSSGGIRWETWHSDLRRLGDLPLTADGQELADRLLQQLGLSDALPRISLHVKEDGLAGYTGVIKPGRDVRVLIRPLQSLSSLTTLCHELGHACYHALNQAQGIWQTWSSCYDEAMAILLEQIGLVLLSGDRKRLRRAREIALLENVRCAVSFLFELDLWQEPRRAEELYLEHYSCLGLDVGEPALWALDSFRSIDPMYIQNYVLGAILAEQKLGHLIDCYGEDLLAWGEELRQLYAPGRRNTLMNIVRGDRQ